MATSPKAPTKSKTKGKPTSKAKAPASTASKSAARSSKAPVSRAKVKTADPSPQYLVFGTITYPDAKPAAGLTVIAYDQDESGKDTLGQPATTDPAGNYKIAYSDADFRKTEKERGGADVFVRVYNDKRDVLLTSKKKNDAPAEYELNITLPDEQFMVRGKVTDANQKPLANLFVHAFDRDLRFPQLLGTAETDAAGQYRIGYRAAEFQLADLPARRTPWLIVDVREAPDGEVLARQEVQKAAPDQTVSFTLTSAGAVSEWQRVGETVDRRAHV